MKTDEIHRILVEARNVQERRGYDWGNGYPEEEGPVCPACAIASVVGRPSFLEVRDHPAALALAAQFPGYGSLSARVNVWEEAWEDGPPLELVLAAYDRAVAATAPQPDLTFLAEVRDAVSA